MMIDYSSFFPTYYINVGIYAILMLVNIILRIGLKKRIIIVKGFVLGNGSIIVILQAH